MTQAPWEGCSASAGLAFAAAAACTCHCSFLTRFHRVFDRVVGKTRKEGKTAEPEEKKETGWVG